MKRVKVEGDLFHGRVPEGAIYVGREKPRLKRSRYANPYKEGVYGLDECLRLCRAYMIGTLTPEEEAAIPEKWAQKLYADGTLLRGAVEDLAGRELAC